MPASAAADSGTGRRPSALDEGEGLRGPGGRSQPQLGEKLGAHDETQARRIRVGGLEQPVTTYSEVHVFLRSCVKLVPSARAEGAWRRDSRNLLQINLHCWVHNYSV